MTDFTKLIFTSEADALTNVNSGSIAVTIPAGTQASLTTEEYSNSDDVAGATFSQMLIGQDNFLIGGGSNIQSASEYMYFAGDVQLLIPADVPTAGIPFDETPAKVYAEVSGDNLTITVSVANPYPDTIDVEETTVTVYYFGYEAFQES